jgi:hypothetical protein
MNNRHMGNFESFKRSLFPRLGYPMVEVVRDALLNLTDELEDIYGLLFIDCGLSIIQAHSIRTHALKSRLFT